MSTIGATAPTPTHVWNPWQDLPWQERGPYPVVPPPPGMTANLVNPISQVKWGIFTISLCISIATILTMLRMYAKIWILRCPGWEDWTALAGYFGLITQSGLVIAMGNHGAGRHERDVIGYDFTTWLQLMFIDEILYGPVMFLIKLSILLLYLRIFRLDRWTTIISYIILWVNLAFYGAGALGEVFQCAPIEKFWYPLLPGHCVNQKAVQFASSGINLVSDIAILLLPMFVVRTLQTTRKKKIGLFAIFGFGVL